jgi:hypothetical protein
MANVIKHKRGSGSDPSASNLVVGELAIRTDTGKLFTKMDSGALAEIAGGGSDIAINTLSSSSGTGGGSATFNGSAYRFTLSSPPSVSAAQLLVSINGVIQKPVAGTGQPSEGFSVDGNDIILGDAPATGSDFFILTFRSLGVSVPADNSVTSAKIVDGAIVNADINASAAIAGTKIDPSFTSDITVTNTQPKISLVDTNANDDFEIKVNAGNFAINDATNSVNRLLIDSSGDIGIGTTSMAGKLNVQGSAGGVALQTTDATNSTFRISHPSAAVTLLSGGSSQHLALGTGFAEKMRIDSSGNVGIGTTSPDEKLHVANTSGGASILIETNNSSGGNILFGDDASNTVGRVQYVHSDDSMRLFTASSERMRIDSSGKVGINIAGTDNTSPVRNLDIADSSGAILRLISSDDSLGANERVGEIEFFTDDDDGGHIGSFVKAIADPSDSFGRRTALLFGTQSAESQNAVERMRIDSFGNVGIGTTSPSAKLQVSGGHINIGSGYSYQWGNSHERIEQSDGKIEFFTNNGEQMTLSGSNLGIGLTSPTSTLHVNGDIRTANRLGVGTAANYANIVSYVSGTGSYPPSGGLVQTNNADSTAMFWNASNSANYTGLSIECRTTGAAYWMIANVYNSSFSGDLAFRTRTGGSSNAERVRFLRGGGITFNGDTAAANALDDYEEGTFTVGFKFSNQSFNGSLSTAQGYYTKIGRQVTVSFQLIVSNKGSNTSGHPVITGLPFTVLNADNGRASGVVGYMSGVSGIDFPILVLVEQNQTDFPLRQSQSSGAANLDSSNFDNGFRMYATITYFV